MRAPLMNGIIFLEQCALLVTASSLYIVHATRYSDNGGCYCSSDASVAKALQIYDNEVVVVGGWS